VGRDARARAAAGLLHAGLAPATVVFDGGAARATDAADCGWGFHLYDLAVTLVACDGRPRAPALRSAFLAEHDARGTLPAGADDRLAALGLLRRIQQLVRLVEARKQPALRERWRDDARGLLDRIADALRSVG